MKYKDQSSLLFMIYLHYSGRIKYRPYWGLMEILKQNRVDSALTGLLVCGRVEIQQWTGLTFSHAC